MTVNVEFCTSHETFGNVSLHAWRHLLVRACGSSYVGVYSKRPHSTVISTLQGNFGSNMQSNLFCAQMRIIFPLAFLQELWPDIVFLSTIVVDCKWHTGRYISKVSKPWCYLILEIIFVLYGRYRCPLSSLPLYLVQNLSWNTSRSAWLSVLLEER